MLVAAGYGALAASSLLVGMGIALAWVPSRRLLGLVLAFGAGALFSAIAFELTDSAIRDGSEHILAIGMVIGAVTYIGGSRLVRSSASTDADDTGEDDARAIVLGAALDGIPESLAIGAAFAAAAGDTGAMSLTLLVAVALSNLPEALGATAGLRAAGHPTRGIVATWVAMVIVAGVSSAVGYGVLTHVPDTVAALLDAFTAGAVLAMLTDTMIPDAYRDARGSAGLATVVGFTLAFLIS